MDSLSTVFVLNYFFPVYIPEQKNRPISFGDMKSALDTLLLSVTERCIYLLSAAFLKFLQFPDTTCTYVLALDLSDTV